jgi:adenosylcobinamide kinase / adenosylcobinamide-phosphate guanylyltransferase
MSLVLLTGGVRSGKSDAAVRRAEAEAGQIVFIATAEAGDAEMAARIERHRSQRPAHWETIEEPRELETALRKADPHSCVIVDCLTLWVTKLLLDGLSDAQIEQRAEAAADIAVARPGTTIVITNEVGSSVHPETELGRRFADLMGRANTRWSERADEAWLMVMGRGVYLKKI